MPFENPIVIQEHEGTEWRLFLANRYIGSQGDSWELPEHYITDLATVPSFLWWFVTPYGKGITAASIWHDHALTDLLPYGLISSRDADGIFRKIMEEAGVGPALRWVMWTGVRWGAVFKRSRGEVLHDLPRMIAISIPVAIPLLIATPGILLAKLLMVPFLLWRRWPAAA